MRFRVHATVGSFSVVLSLSVVGVGLVKDFCTLGDVDIFIRHALIYEGASDDLIFG